MHSLIASVTMHSVRIDHEIELLALTMKLIQQLNGILMVNIIITGTMSQLQHDGIFSAWSASADGVSSLTYRITVHIIHHLGHLISFGIILWSIHISLGIMRIIKCPIVDSATGNSIMELIGSTHHK